MTSLLTLAAARDETRPRAAGRALRVHAPTMAVSAALAWWATYFTWGTGGREPRVLSVACALLLVGIVLVRPWRAVPVAALVLCNGVGVAAFTVVLTAPTGLAGVHEAASYAYAAQLGLLVLAWASTGPRRTALLTALLAAAGLQFTQGWLPWWGLQDPTKLFQGTFYWHNQAGIFLAAGALLAFTVVVAGQRPLAPLAWVVGPLCAAGVVFTTSRGSQLGLVLGTVMLLGLAVACRGVRRRAWRLVGVAGLSWVLAQVLVGPPFFAQRVSATASTAARADSFVSNGVQRIEDWRRAFAIFWEWPVTGAGFYSFDSATEIATTKRDGVSTAFAHNGFLQAAADGGVVLAVPLFLAIGAVLAVSLHALPAALRSGDFVRLGALVTLLVLLLHSGMDFDWTYPALLSLAALVAVLALPAHPDLGRRSRVVGMTFAAASVLLLVASMVGAWQGGLDLNTTIAALR